VSNISLYRKLYFLAKRKPLSYMDRQAACGTVAELFYCIGNYKIRHHINRCCDLVFVLSYVYVNTLWICTKQNHKEDIPGPLGRILRQHKDKIPEDMHHQ